MRRILLVFAMLGCCRGFPAFAQTASPPLDRRIPAPTGPFAVGRTERFWVDSSRAEPFVPGPSARREVAVHLWYPADGRPVGPQAPYIPHIAEISTVLGDSGMTSAFGAVGGAIASGVVPSHSFAEAPVRRQGRPFPVLVFSPGFGESCLTYSAQLEELASQGYVVFGIDHPYDASAVWLPGNRIVQFASARWNAALAQPKGAVSYQLAQVPLRTGDIRFVIDRVTQLDRGEPGNPFEGTLDLGQIGAFGHSLGGIAAASACRWDARIRACMNEDADEEGRPFDGGPAALPLKQPFLFMATGHSIYRSPRTPPPTDDALARMRLSRAEYDSITALYQHNQDAALAALPGGSVRIDAEAADFTHRSFIDLKVLQATDSAAVARQQQYLAMVRRYTRAFFGEALRGESSPLLSGEGAVDSLLTVEHFGKSIGR